MCSSDLAPTEEAARARDATDARAVAPCPAAPSAIDGDAAVAITRRMVDFLLADARQRQPFRRGALTTRPTFAEGTLGSRWCPALGTTRAHGESSTSTLVRGVCHDVKWRGTMRSGHVRHRAC